MKRNRKGFSNRTLPPGINKKKVVEDDKVGCCIRKNTFLCNADADRNSNQLLMTVCTFLAFVDNIEKRGLHLNVVIASSEEIYKLNKKWFTLDKLNFLEFSLDGTVSLLYKIVGLKKVSPYQPYKDLIFHLTPTTDFLVNTFNDWFSFGYNRKTILQYSSHVVGIIKTDKFFYIFDPNVNDNEEHKCELYQCDSLQNFAQFLLESIKKKDEAINNVTYRLVAVATLAPITSLELYVTSDPNYDKHRVAKTQTQEKLKILFNGMHTLTAGQKRLRDREYKANLRQTEEGRRLLNARNRDFAAQKKREKDAEDWNISMQNQHEKLNHLKKEISTAYVTDKSKLRDFTREYLQLLRQNRIDEETAKNQRQQNEYEKIENNETVVQKINDHLQRKREYMANKKNEMSAEEVEEYLEQKRKYMATTRKAMSAEEIAEILKRDRERMAGKKNKMSAEEVEEYLQHKRDLWTNKMKSMEYNEKLEYLDQQKDLMATKRKNMTKEAKEIEISKSRQRYNMKKDDYNEKNQLTASITKHLKFKGKKSVLITNVTAALGGKAESNVEAEQLVNTILKHQQNHIYQLANSLTSFVYSLKVCKSKYDKKDSLTEKFWAMMGSSLHTKNSESYFFDSSYTPISKGVYAINEDGKIMDLFEPLECKNGTSFVQWKCNAMCKIDEKMIFERFHYIIEEILKSNPAELVDFINHMDDCPRINLWNRMVKEINTTAASSGTDDIINEENGENCMDCTVPIERRRGHPHACYINYPDNFGCTSQLLFFRCLAPHFASCRTIVSTLYKLKGLLKEFEIIDKSIAELHIEELQDICDAIKGKAGDNFVSSVEWPYAHESTIITKYYSAFVALKKKSLDVPLTACVSCLKLFPDSNIRSISDFTPNLNVWEDLLDKQGDKYKFICNPCHAKFKKMEYPATCILNHLEVRTPPQCVTRLNDYEKIFIQRAKAFQVVTRMGTVAGRRGPTNQHIQKLKGRTFHLPLPLEKTLEKLPTPQQAVIPNQDVYILVRGEPTKQRKVWQQFVNVNRLYQALEWLKQNNPLYAQIVMPNSPDALLEELDDIDVQFNEEQAPAADTGTQPENAPPENVTQLPVEDEVPIVTQKDIDDPFYEHVTIHSLGEERPNEDTSTIYQMKKVVARPIDNRANDLDIKCFPDLFCYGENGMRAERAIPLTLGEFIKCKVMSVHSEFRLNIQYLFFLLSLINQNQIYAGIYTTMNTSAAVKNMTVRQLKTKIADKEFDKNACNIFSRLRNSRAFWNKPRNDIDCMTRHYGPATWFLTFSPSEYDWEDLEKYLKDVNGDKGKGKSRSALIAMDPISTSRFMDNKFHAMLAFLSANNGPLGTVEHYAWRREYQSRGLQHFHLLIWIKDAPILGQSTVEEVSEFISKYASCHLPDPTNFPELHSRVSKYQMHKHNSYCQRKKKTKKGKFITTCRFGFSRPITQQFVMRDVATSIHGRRKLKLKSRLYDLKRNGDEIDVNDYNPAVLMAWQGNTDIQFIGEKTCALTQYITKYTTKAEKSFSTTDFSNISASKSLYSKLWLIGQRTLTNRECGALEAADTLLQISLFGTDQNTVIKWLDVRMERNRKLKKWSDVLKMKEDQTDIFMASLIDTHYPARPVELEEECLYDFARKYDIVDKKPQSGVWYKFGDRYIHARKKPCLVNHYNYNMVKNKEQYFYSLLLLFKPFKSETSLLGEFKTYAEAFEDCKETLTAALQYHEKIQELRRAAEELDEKIKKIHHDDDKDDASNASNSQNIIQCDPIDDNAFDVRACLNVEQPTIESVNEMIHGLNEDQLRIFNNIRQILTERKNNTGNSKILRQFISGVGGTGKSYLIKLIRAWVKVELHSEVMVAAPTGIAAFNIEGLTIHRLLKLPVEHGSTAKYKNLTDKNLKQLRNVLKNVLLIIIDEVSMASNLTMVYIHLRLQEIYNTSNTEDGWFGGQNILLFGDLLQLSPVMAQCPFITLKGADLVKYVESINVDINLWADLFSYDELTINVRQKSDLQYADILSRIRLGFVTANDEQALRNRQITFTNTNGNYKDYLNQIISAYKALPANCLCLLSTKKQCSELNEAMLALLPGDMTIINTKDKVEGRTMAQRKEANAYLKKLSADSSNTGGLEETLAIKVGCKVMLRRNIDPQRGLVNGAIGTVLKLNVDLSNNEVSSINIRFSKEDYLLERLEVKFEIFTNIYAIRSQFPITLAYGITIHKSQALSLDYALTDIGNTVFCDGQTYVALSRLTSIDGLNIINFDPKNVHANADAINEYNRLRRLYRPDLPQIDIVRNRSHSRPDTVWWPKEIVADPTPPIDTPITELPGFVNPDNNCYANSTLQCLLNFRSINRSIMLGPSSSLKTLTLQYNDAKTKLLNASEIITNVGFPLGIQQDVIEFIFRLSNTYPEISNNFTFQLKATRTCKTHSCGHVGINTYTVNQRELGIPTAATTTALNIRDIFNESFQEIPIPDYKCDFCQQYNTMERYEILNPGKIFIISLNVFVNEVHRVQGQPPTATFYRIPLKLKALPTTILEVCGLQYQLKAAAFHLGATQNSGHYVAYVKSNGGDGWTLANDTITTNTRWARNSVNAYVLFYERK